MTPVIPEPTYAKVIRAITLVCAVSQGQVSPSSDLADLGLDSLNLTSLIAALESQCGELSQDQLEKAFEARTVGDIVELLDQSRFRGGSISS